MNTFTDQVSLQNRITSSSMRIAFDDAGEGDPALLFLPGWCGGRSVFGDLLPLAARNRRVVALDWRGHGESEHPEGDFETDDLVDDALSVIHQAGVAQVVPVGLSHAGWVAIELRRRLGPSRVPGIVLLDWMVLGPPPPFLGALAGLQERESWREVRAALFEMWTTGVHIPALDRYIEEMATYGFESWRRAGREIAARFGAEESPVRSLERLELACPTLHVYAQPRDDDFLAAQQAYSAANSWFRVHRLSANSHFPMLEVPTELIAAVEAFVLDFTQEPPDGS
jgi:pimeloyl-ACP methyl ester carboxylesterase